ncbi:hypothetical protein M6B38_346940 [Iris pallida]|uniref:Uncharacterized protein n=1 Tax=Iris pallida TaxID=29817 RepID=A0AAX6GU72_IRIPA|nr:hypothetical protein M6B38_346940 [Iris pallida]
MVPLCEIDLSPICFICLLVPSLSFRSGNSHMLDVGELRMTSISSSSRMVLKLIYLLVYFIILFEL